MGETTKKVLKGDRASDGLSSVSDARLMNQFMN